ncbi:MAG: tRNA-binding protein [Calditrichaeota bacterium]|nr:tRNA-binding protein [Calditrichota bacterium]
METINWDDFQKVALCVGTIIDAQEFPEARKPAYKLWVDFGADIGVKQSSAQITAHHCLSELIGKQVIGVVNFPPKQIGPFISECLVTGFHDQNGDVILAIPEKPVPNGTRLL